MISICAKFAFLFVVILQLSLITQGSSQSIVTVNSANIPNCFLTYRGLCFRCDKGFGLNPDKTGCLSNNEHVENCHHYGLKEFISTTGLQTIETVCQICTIGFGTYIYKETLKTFCTNNQFQNRVRNCAQYDKEMMCVRCKHSYMYDHGNFDFGLSFDKTQCLDNIAKKNENCLIYKSDEIECDMCIEGYFLDQTTQKCLQTSFTDCQIGVIDTVIEFGVEKQIEKCQTCIKSNFQPAQQGEFRCYQVNFCTRPQNDCCINPEKDRKCKDCLPDIFLKDQEGYCQELKDNLANCKILDTINKNQCGECQGNLVVGKDINDPEKTVCRDPLALQNCKTTQLYRICQQCNADYTLSWDRTRCIANIQSQMNCDLLALDPKFCSICKIGYQLLVDGTCVLQRSPSTASLIGGGCNPFTDANGCLDCIEVNFPFPNKADGQCYVSLLLDSCYLSYDKKLCKICQPGYFLGANLICYSQSKLNCIQGDSDRFCSRCKYGYMNVNGICYQNPLDNQECEALDSTGQCSMCIEGYEIDSISSKCKQKPQFIMIQNCMFHFKKPSDVQTYCQICQAGYILTTTQEMCQIDMEGCLYKVNSESKQECDICQEGYVKGKENPNQPYGCFQPPSNQCLAANENGVCTLCINYKDSDFGLLNGNCVDNRDLSPSTAPLIRIAACQEYFPDTNQCRFCHSQYKLDNQQCIIFYLAELNNVTGDKTKHEYRVWENCINTFIPSAPSMNRLGCSKCKPGYILFLDQGLSETLTQGCYAYTDAASFNRCLYTIAENTCLQCQPYSYEQSYYKFSSIPSTPQLCSSSTTPMALPSVLVQNCLDYDDELQNCILCVVGYTVFNNFCHKTIPNCLKYSDNSNCLLCTLPLFPTNIITGSKFQNRCALIDQKTYPHCAELYVLDTSKPDAYDCMRCITGYQITKTKQLEFQCYSDIKNCAEFSSDYLQCINCNSGYILYLGLCFQEIISCIEYSPIGLCQKCQDGFAMKLNGLECRSSVFLVNCRYYNDPLQCISTECNVGYRVLESEGICSLIVEGCGEIDQFGNCIKCQDAQRRLNTLKTHCFKAIPGCAVAESDFTCEQCEDNYVISTDRQFCYLIPKLCANVSGNNQCSLCDQKIAIKDPNEISKINCLLKNDGSLTNPFWCKEYDSSNQCTACFSGFGLNQSSNICILNDDIFGVKNCLIYKDLISSEFDLETQAKCQNFYQEIRPYSSVPEYVAPSKSTVQSSNNLTPTPSVATVWSKLINNNFLQFLLFIIYIYN